MSKRSAQRNRPRQRAAKAAIPVGGTAVSFSPAQLSAMLAAQQQLQSGNMTAQPLPQSPYWETAPFGPGRRLPPAPINTVRPDTGRAEPRLWEFPVSWNLQIDDRWHVPWKTLQHAADMPLFRKCIERRKSVCGLDFTVTVDPKAVARAAALSGSATKDVESELRKQYMSEISRITDWLQEPDPKNGLDWQAWTSLLMENQLKFGASVVYPRKTFGGDLFALEVIDSKTIKPLLDEYGGRPAPPQPAYQQIMYGFPRGEFIADADVGMDGAPFVPGGFSSDELVYERRMLRSESPYGLSATEIALLDGLVWMRRMGWILSEYTEGVTPGGLVETDPTTGWDVTQWQDFSASFNAMLEGDTAARQKWPFMPPGTKMIQPQTIPEQYKPDYDLFLIKLVAGDFGLPASEVGFTETGALGASFHEGEEDILNRQTRIPDADWLSKIATKLCKRQLRMPGVLQVQILGLESEDEAAADAVAAEQVSGARLTVNEDRARRGLPTYTFPEADMPMLTTPRGVVFLEGASQTAPPGTLVGPAVAPPRGSEMAGGPDDATGMDEQDNEDEQDGPPSKTAEKAALRRYLAKDRSRPFECRALTAADVPALASDPRVLFKDGPGKVPAGIGPAGSGTGSW
jgi:hypothetical protein